LHDWAERRGDFFRSCLEHSLVSTGCYDSSEEAGGMAIDNPKAAFEQQYMQEKEESAFGLAVFTGKLAFPKAAMPLEIFDG
jgi:hypothetical protein